MFLFQFACKVRADGELVKNERFDNVGGAYVHIWVNFKELAGARVLAQYYLEQAGWLAEKELDVWVIKKRECKKKDRKYYKEAAKYGYCTVSYMWSRDAPDADQNYED
jgi:hypothetical protein